MIDFRGCRLLEEEDSATFCSTISKGTGRDLGAQIFGLRSYPALSALALRCAERVMYASHISSQPRQFLDFQHSDAVG